MGLLVSNNATTTLAAGAMASDTQVTVSDASRLPAMAAGDWFWLTLSDAAETTWEIVKVTGRAGAALTVARGQDGTTALDWPPGAKASMRLVSQIIRDMSAGGGGNIVSDLSGSTINLTAGATLTPGKMHRCTYGNNGNYSVILPDAKLNSGAVVGVTVDTSFSNSGGIYGINYVTVSPTNPGEMQGLTGFNGRAVFAKESLIFMCDGSKWCKIADSTTDLYGQLFSGAGQNQLFSASTLTRVAFQNYHGALYNNIQGTAFLARPGLYYIEGGVTLNNTNPSDCDAYISLASGVSLGVDPSNLSRHERYNANSFRKIHIGVLVDVANTPSVELDCWFSAGAFSGSVLVPGESFLTATEIQSW